MCCKKRACASSGPILRNRLRDHSGASPTRRAFPRLMTSYACAPTFSRASLGGALSTSTLASSSSALGSTPSSFSPPSTMSSRGLKGFASILDPAVTTRARVSVRPMGLSPTSNGSTPGGLSAAAPPSLPCLFSRRGTRATGTRCSRCPHVSSVRGTTSLHGSTAGSMGATLGTPAPPISSA